MQEVEFDESKIEAAETYESVLQAKKRKQVKTVKQIIVLSACTICIVFSVGLVARYVNTSYASQERIKQYSQIDQRAYRVANPPKP